MSSTDESERSGWQQYRGGPARLGFRKNSPGDGEEPEQAWVTRLGSVSSSPPTVANDTAYIVDEEGTVLAYDVETGDKLWESSPEEYATEDGRRFEVETAPAVENGIVCIISDEGVYGFDAEDGSVRWARDRTDDRNTVRPPEANGRTGETLWNRSLETSSSSCLAIADGIVYVPSQGDTGLYALDLDTGETEWFLDMDSSYNFRADPVCPTVANGKLAMNTRKHVLIIDPETREVEVSFSAGEPTPPSAHNGAIYFGDDETVFALDIEDGTSRWRIDTEESLPGSPAVGDDAVYITGLHDSDDKGVSAVDHESGDVMWEFGVRDLFVDMRDREEHTLYIDKITSAVATDDGVYLAINNRNEEECFMLGVAADDGTPKWKHELTDMPAHSPALAGDMLMFGADRDLTAVSMPDIEQANIEVVGEEKAEAEAEQLDDEPREVVLDLLREHHTNKYEIASIPEDTGLSEEQSSEAIEELESEGSVEREEWAGDMQVKLLDDPDAEESEVTSDDVAELVDLLETEEELAGQSVAPMTGWTEAKADAVVDHAEAAGEVNVQSMGGVDMLSIDTSGVVGGVDVAAGETRPTADDLRPQMDNPELAEALAVGVQNAEPDGTVEFMDIMGDLPDQEDWGMLMHNGYITQEGAESVIELPDGVDFEFQG